MRPFHAEEQHVQKPRVGGLGEATSGHSTGSQQGTGRGHRWGWMCGQHQISQAPYSWSSPESSTFPKKYFQTEGPSWMNSLLCENVVKVQEISSLTHSVIGRHWLSAYHGPSIVVGVGDKIPPSWSMSKSCLGRENSDNWHFLSFICTKHGLWARHSVRCSIENSGLHFNWQIKGMFQNHNLTSRSPK